MIALTNVTVSYFSNNIRIKMWPSDIDLAKLFIRLVLDECHKLALSQWHDPEVESQDMTP